MRYKNRNIYMSQAYFSFPKKTLLQGYPKIALLLSFLKFAKEYECLLCCRLLCGALGRSFTLTDDI